MNPFLLSKAICTINTIAHVHDVYMQGLPHYMTQEHADVPPGGLVSISQRQCLLRNEGVGYALAAK
jgi:hypothetical protein